MFRNLNFSLATAMSFLLGLALFGALTFLPLYQQTVQHASATASGLLLIPLLLGSTVTSIIGGQITTKTGRYKALPIVGGAIMTFAMYLLTHLGPDTSRLTSGIYFAILGIGMGFLMQITTLIVQNSVEPQGHGRGQQLPDVLPADRRLDRRLAVRRDLHPAAGRVAERPAARRAPAHQQRPAGPGHDQPAARR